MTELNVLYGGNEDNYTGDNLESVYQPQKTNKISNSDTLLYTEDKPSKAPQYNANVPIVQQQTHNGTQSQQMQQMQQMQKQATQPYYSNSNYDNHAKNYNLLDNSQYITTDNYKRRYEYNFFDRMSAKRTEVVKLALFSLVIVLGISIDRMLTYYLSKYIGENILTDFQELLLRLSYPITIFLLLWIFKAL